MTSSAQKRAGAVFAKVERRTKTPGVQTHTHLFVLVTSHSAASGAAYVASASRRRRATPRRRVLVFTVAALSRCARAAAPPLCHHSSAPNRSRAGHTVARLERVRTAATLERRAQSVWQEAVAFTLPLLANRPRAAELLHACELSSVRHVALHVALQVQIPVCFLCDGRTGARPPGICGLLCVKHDSNRRTTPGDRARN